MSRTRRAALADLGRDVRSSLRREDLALDSAGVTFYAAVAVVPLILLSAALASLLVGAATVQRLAGMASLLLPADVGARAVSEQVLTAGTTMTPLQLVSCVLPATLYGEGLLRAFDRLTREPAGRLLGVYLGFLVAWVQVSILLVVVYRLLARRTVDWRALAWGAAGTGSVVAGFLLGLVLFLSLDLPLGQPFGGFFPVGAAVAVGLWMFLLHVLVLVGYAATLRLQVRGGHPLGPVLGEGAAAVPPPTPATPPAPVRTA